MWRHYGAEPPGKDRICSVADVPGFFVSAVETSRSGRGEGFPSGSGGAVASRVACRRRNDRPYDRQWPPSGVYRNGRVSDASPRAG